jgi:hypothetical protein
MNTDFIYTAHISAFVLSVNEDFHLVLQLSEMVPMKEGFTMFPQLVILMSRFKLLWEKSLDLLVAGLRL